MTYYDMSKTKIYTFKSVFPRGTAAEVQEQLAETSPEVSLGTIQRILAGEIKDMHGVLPIAIKLTEKKQKEQDKINNKIALLKLKTSHPLKSK